MLNWRYGRKLLMSFDLFSFFSLLLCVCLLVFATKFLTPFLVAFVWDELGETHF